MKTILIILLSLSLFARDIDFSKMTPEQIQKYNQVIKEKELQKTGYLVVMNTINLGTVKSITTEYFNRDVTTTTEVKLFVVMDMKTEKKYLITSTGQIFLMNREKE